MILIPVTTDYCILEMITVNLNYFSNLLLPDGLYQERQKAFYLFDVYKCENLVAKPSVSVNDKSSKKVPNIYVEVTFAGQKVRKIHFCCKYSLLENYRLEHL